MKIKAEKKYIFFIAFLCLFCISCNNGLTDTPKYSLSQVKSVIVLNKTEEDKKADECNLKINPSSYVNIAASPTFVPYYPENSNFRAVLSDNESAIPVKTISKDQRRSFSIHFKSAEVEMFTCVYISNHAYIWLRNSEMNTAKTLSEEEYLYFADKFDKIYEQETALCGPKFSGVEEDKQITYPYEKVSILFYDIDDDGSGSYGGYYNSYDMYDRTINGRTVPGIECIHIDSCYAKKKDTRGYSISTLSHEFNHKLNYDNKFFKYGLQLETWYTEMLSMLVEDFFFEDFGIDRLSSSQGRLGTFVKQHRVGFKNWSYGNSAENCKYANAYAFGAYLARNYGGAELIHEICTNEYVNEESIVKAVNKINKTNLTFDDLLEKFPFILINNDNNLEGYPSLNHEWKGSLPELPDYEFKLYNIDYKEINTQLKPENQIKITSDDKTIISNLDIGAYGFCYFAYDKPTNVTVYAKKDLFVTGL